MNHPELEMIMRFPRILHTTMRKMVRGFQSSQHEVNRLNDTLRRTLLILHDQGALNMTQLHHFIGREKASMTAAVDRLIEKGLVERKSVAHDRRKVKIDLTPSGRRKTDIFTQEIAEHIRGNLGKLPAKDRDRLFHAFTILDEISLKL